MQLIFLFHIFRRVSSGACPSHNVYYLAQMLSVDPNQEVFGMEEILLEQV